MSQAIPDNFFARQLVQMGIATLDQIEAAQREVIEARAINPMIGLADVVVRQGLITQAMRENVEKAAVIAQQGGIKQLGPYKILKKLGEGGMGAVYLADDMGVGRKVALKVLPKKYASDQVFLARFRREARATGQLNHANIVTAYTTGEDMGVYYYAMEFCDGESLDAFQLPTEAQWEYACRGGSTTRFCSGDDEKDLGIVGWYSANSESKTHPVGEKKPNAFGLYDMHGNVAQWCQDGYRQDYENLPSTDPFNARGTERVLRGGSWSDPAEKCRSASRDRTKAISKTGALGFRIVLAVPPKEPGK